MKQYLLDYLNSSDAERQVRAAVLGKTQQQILREIEIEQFYDNTDTSFPNIQCVDFEIDPIKLTIAFSQISFNEMQPKSGNVKYPMMLCKPVEKTIIFQENEIKDNKRLMDILNKWEFHQRSYANYINHKDIFVSNVVQQIQTYFSQNGESERLSQ